MRLGNTLSPIAIALILSSSILVTACDDKTQQQKGDTAKAPQKMMVKVETETIKSEPFTAKTILPGRINAYRVAEIRPQVSGTVLKREFTESSNVKTGDSLYLIDPAVYRATYNSALASLASARANAKIARITANRNKSLVGSKAVSKQEYDNAIASAEQADAAVKVAEAAVNTAKVNLDYTKVYSPIDGYIGKSNVTEGALVTTGQATPLAIVQQLDHVYVDMTQPIEDYSKIQQRIDSGYYHHNGEKIEVELQLNDGTMYKHKGYIEFTDISVSETTSSVFLRAVFPNPEQILLPGLFVKPIYTEGIIENAILIPQKTLSRNTQGTAFVYLVNEDNQIIIQPVEAEKTIGNDWLITKGLKNGDRLVTSGFISLSQLPQGVTAYADISESANNNGTNVSNEESTPVAAETQKTDENAEEKPVENTENNDQQQKSDNTTQPGNESK